MKRKGLMVSAYLLGNLLVKNKKKMLFAVGAFLAGEIYRLIRAKYFQSSSEEGRKRPDTRSFKLASGAHGYRASSMAQGSSMKH